MRIKEISSAALTLGVLVIAIAFLKYAEGDDGNAISFTIGCITIWLIFCAVDYTRRIPAVQRAIKIVNEFGRRKVEEK